MAQDEGSQLPQGDAHPGRSELRRAVLLAVAAVSLANAAWLLGLFGAPAGTRLSGIHTVNSADTPTYFAWIEQARRGELLFRQLYTTEPHERALFHPLFLGVGSMARTLDLSSPTAYHVARILLSLLFVALAWLFFSTCHRDPRTRLASLGLLLFSSGVGWLWIALGRGPPEWPLDLWVPEAVPFLSLIESPLNLAAYALWALIGVLSIRHLEHGGRARLAGLAACAALLACLRPHAGVAPVLALATLGGVAVVLTRRVPPRRALGTAAALIAGVAVGIVPPALTLASEPVFAGWRRTASASAPAPLAFLAGLCFPLLCAALGARRIAAREGVAGAWLLAWIGGVLALTFAPVGPLVPVARKLLEALPLALAAVGGEGARRLLGAVDGPRRSLGAAVLVALLLASAASSALVLVHDARAFRRGELPQVLPDCLAESFEHLSRQGGSVDVVLAPAGLGLLVPAFTGHTVVCCHYDQTLDAERKEREVNAFFAPGRAPRKELLERHRVEFVLLPARRRAPRELLDAFETELRTPCLEVWRRR